MGEENKWLIKRCDNNSDTFVADLGGFSAATAGAIISIDKYCYSLMEKSSGFSKTPVFELHETCLGCFNKQSTTVLFTNCNSESEDILMNSGNLKFVPNLSDVYDVNILIEGNGKETKIITGCYTYNGYSDRPLPENVKILQNGEFNSFKSCDDCVGPYIKDLQAWGAKLSIKSKESKQSYLNLISGK